MNILFDKIKPLLSGEVFLLTITLGTFLFGVYLYKRLKFPLIQPLLVSIAIIIPFLKIADIDYTTFYEQTHILNFMLGPSVVALGYVLYEQIEHIKGHVVSILTSVFVGCIVGIVSVIGIAKLLGADHVLQMSLAPKSVTTPIAISLAQQTGGVPELTVAFVVICGIFGGLVGPVILRYIGIKSRIAQGLAIGSASHALGTVRALEMGAIEGAISGLAIGIMGIMTALLLPLIQKLLAIA